MPDQLLTPTQLGAIDQAAYDEASPLSQSYLRACCAAWQLGCGLAAQGAIRAALEHGADLEHIAPLIPGRGSA